MTQAVETSNRFPSQIKFIVGNEACERFSYYGMRAILVVFMTKYLMMSEPEAKESYHLFVSACYLLPLAGAFLSDRFLGKYRTIFWLSMFYCLGHLTLALFESKMGLFVGLGLISLGSGGIKPCVSAYVGDQFTDKNQHLIQKVYDLFYFSINFGSFFSSLLIPWILPKYGPSWAFGIPGILMAIALLVFWLGRREYINVPPSKTSAGFMAIFMEAIKNVSRRKPGQGFWEGAMPRYSREDIEGAQAAGRIFKVFITVSVFWALFDQNGSSWVLQAEKMDLDFWGMHIEASQLQAANPIMVMILIPFFAYVVYPLWGKYGPKVTPLRKMSVGMVLAAVSFVAVGLIQNAIDAGAHLNVMWQLVPYLILTASEVMVSITGLEFAYTQAPPSMKSTIMSFWLLTVFGGNMLVAYVARLNVFQGAGEFYFFAGLMFAVSFVFIWTASRYKTRDYIAHATGGH